MRQGFGLHFSGVLNHNGPPVSSRKDLIVVLASPLEVAAVVAVEEADGAHGEDGEDLHQQIAAQALCHGHRVLADLLGRVHLHIAGGYQEEDDGQVGEEGSE